jgi:hypothetical protein
VRLPRRFYTAAWAAIGLAIAAIEALALVDRQRGDTLTEKVRKLLSYHRVVWFVGLGLAAWAIAHFFFGWS